MAYVIEPLTGVKINDLAIKQASLNSKSAVTACVLKLQGWTWHHIAAALGTNPHRLGEVFRGEKYPDAERQARALLGLA